MFERSRVTLLRDKKLEGESHDEREISAAGNTVRIAARAVNHAAPASPSADPWRHSLRSETVRAADREKDRGGESVYRDHRILSTALHQRRQSIDYFTWGVANGRATARQEPGGGATHQRYRRDHSRFLSTSASGGEHGSLPNRLTATDRRPPEERNT